MLIDANGPAGIAAQQLASQRESQLQRADSQLQTAAEQSKNDARARTDRANSATETQTRQSVSASDTQDNAVNEERNGGPSAFSRERPSPPPQASGRGQLVDLFA